MTYKQNTEQHRKVVVVGAGSVGATYCYALAQSGLADEMILLKRSASILHEAIGSLEEKY